MKGRLSVDERGGGPPALLISMERGKDGGLSALQMRDLMGLIEGTGCLMTMKDARTGASVRVEKREARIAGHLYQFLAVSSGKAGNGGSELVMCDGNVLAYESRARKPGRRGSWKKES